MTSGWPSRLPATSGRFVGAFDQLHAVLLGIGRDRSLAAAAGMDLGFDDGDRAAQVCEGCRRLVRRVGHDAARHGHAGLAQDFLGLKFVNFHAACSSNRDLASPGYWP